MAVAGRPPPASTPASSPPSPSPPSPRPLVAPSRRGHRASSSPHFGLGLGYPLPNVLPIHFLVACRFRCPRLSVALLPMRLAGVPMVPLSRNPVPPPEPSTPAFSGSGGGRHGGGCRGGRAELERTEAPGGSWEGTSPFLPRPLLSPSLYGRASWSTGTLPPNATLGLCIARQQLSGFLNLYPLSERRLTRG